MIFCGQCGLQLPSGATRCPRCGTPMEGDTAVEEFYVDDLTKAYARLSSSRSRSASRFMGNSFPFWYEPFCPAF